MKGRSNDVSKYRSLSVLNAGYKICSRLPSQRLRAISDIILLEEQSLLQRNVYALTTCLYGNI